MPLAVEVDRNSWSGRSTRRGTGRSDVDHDGLISECGAPAGRSLTEPSLADQSSRHAIGGAVPSYPTFLGADSGPIRSLEDTRSACSVGHALTDQPPVADPTRRSSSGRVEAARQRASTRWRIAIAVVVVALLAVGGFLLFGGDAPLIDNEPTGPGGFGFQLKGIKASPTSRTAVSDLRDTVQGAGNEVKTTMDELYFRAFVDTDSWGDYASAYELFDGPAAAQAEEDAEVLTLGADAGDVYETLDPTTSTISIEVLTDRKDAPSTAIAEVQFLADGQKKDGTSAQISSTGSYFLRQVDGAWRIFAYRVDRGDDATAGSSPTGSPS